MRLKSIRIQNFRCFDDETISFDSHTCFVGPNGKGKSTVLAALNVFFRETKNVSTDCLTLSEEDFHNKRTDRPITITLTFAELSDAAQTDLKAYYRHDELIVSSIATWDANRRQADVSQHGSRLGMKAFAPFFAAEGAQAKVGDLKALYIGLREQFSDLPSPGSKQGMVDALRDYETKHQEQLEPLQSQDQFYGFTRGGSLLDKHVQWVFVPAVKDPSGEQREGKDSDLGRLLARTVRSTVSFDTQLESLRQQVRSQYEELVTGHQSALDGLSMRLGATLKQWTHGSASVALKWECDDKRSIRLDPPLASVIAGEGPFSGELARSGHGFQRAFLLTLLQELAHSDEEDAPTLLLGVEEPELYQHPPQARHMAAVFKQLSEQNAQVILCTHSPLFIGGLTFENVRSVRSKHGGTGSEVRQATFRHVADEVSRVTGDALEQPSTTAIKMAVALQPELNEMFFSDVLVLVEGPEDAAYIRAQLELMDANVQVEYRSLKCHIVPVGGKNKLLNPIIVAQALGIPVFVVCDADSDCNPDSRADHAKLNRAIQTLCGVESTEDLPDRDLVKDGLIMWAHNISKVVQLDLGAANYQAASATARTQHGIKDDRLSSKNSAFVGYVLQAASHTGHRSPRLEMVIRSVLQFARASHPVLGEVERLRRDVANDLFLEDEPTSSPSSTSSVREKKRAL